MKSNNQIRKNFNLIMSKVLFHNSVNKGEGYMFKKISSLLLCMVILSACSSKKGSKEESPPPPDKPVSASDPPPGFLVINNLEDKTKSPSQPSTKK